MNKFAPKSDFLRQRATSLHKSGYKPTEIARMLKISEYSAHSWLRPGLRERQNLQQAMRRAEQAAALRERPIDLPTLAFVPHIKLTENSKYQMRASC